MLYNWIFASGKINAIILIAVSNDLHTKRSRYKKRRRGSTDLSYWFSSIFKPRKLFNMRKIFYCFHVCHRYVLSVCVYNLKRIFCSVIYNMFEKGGEKLTQFLLTFRMTIFFFYFMDITDIHNIYSCFNLCKFLFFLHVW